MSHFLAECFKRANVRAVFAVPGVPVTETLNEIRSKGYTYVCILRNEQTASQAAAVYGYHAGAGSLAQYTDAVVAAMAPSRAWHAMPRMDFEWGRMSSKEQTPNAGTTTDLRPMEQDESMLRSVLSFQPVSPSPGVCITTSGPAFLNALSGVGTAHTNHWPLLLISSSNGSQSPTILTKFQEYPQVKIAEGLKAAGTLKEVFVAKTIDDFQQALFSAISCSLSGVPGPVYLDVPWGVWRSKAVDSSLYLTLTTPLAIEVSVTPIDEPAWAASDILEAYQNAKKPLIILGDELNYAMGCMARFLIRNSQTFLRAPLLTTPMAKGLVCDSDSRTAAAGRSKSLKESDYVFVIGATLNWQFDNSNGWMNNKTKIFILSSDPQYLTFPDSSSVFVPIRGNVAALFLRFLQGISHIDNVKQHEDWRREVEERVEQSWKALKAKVAEQYSQEVSTEDSSRRWRGGLRLDHCFSCLVAPLKEADDFVAGFPDLHPKTKLLLSLWLGVDSLSDSLVTFVCEGATCMDRSRLFLPANCAKARIDAAQFGAMGVGAAFAIGSALWKQVFFDSARDILADLEASPALGPFIDEVKKRASIFLLQGDSAFGFSGLEFETIRRYNFPIAICVLDNGGMYAMEPEDSSASRPSKQWTPAYCLKHTSVTDLTPDFKFADLGRAAGMPVETISWPWDTKIADKLPCLIHFIIDPTDGTQEGHIKSL
eukprot:Gregarina_sp_Pseudo_9__4702@NODE_48_length_4883_cov_281_420520_g45_i0_p1_GENE_NODE_48_length_4883_cov_281_420520_g45_i0NODE_48_length_4883_cov_281_420520_g45_i0_p1_ORF_typecomplete_len710_score157_19TPP_enzyme_N/PF02776_18/6_9e24TPP_enzyme_C/PF02775_21/2_3e02TPP_enzyme_C/PF02775_21/1e15TPP_enzyme_M/PF00205_22/3_6e11TPP_enzyme_M/PF00205_22/3_4e03CW_binding_2/PF04122_12/1_2e04CW_binding_2/PF04122_12/1_1CW_binding_2/PF04122_12/2_9e03_NODE_48_length_4883_cov_281_420520_g45_i01242253